MKSNKGALYVLICYVCWGVLPVFWKTLAGVNSLYVLAQRVAWSALLSALLLLLFRKGPAVRAAFENRQELLRLMLAGVFVCVNWGLYIWAINSDHMLDASLAYYMNPILTILLGTLVFRERLSRLQWLSVAVTFTGLVIAVIRYRQVPWVALMIGGSFALYGALKKGVKTEAQVSVFIETLTLTPLALLFIVFSEMRRAGAVGVLHGWQWLLLPAAGVVTTVPLLCFGRGIKTTTMTLSGILMYVNPTLQLLLSTLLYHESFTTTHAILFGFVWSGLALYLLSGYLEGRRHRKEAAECA